MPFIAPFLSKAADLNLWKRKPLQEIYCKVYDTFQDSYSLGYLWFAAPVKQNLMTLPDVNWPTSKHIICKALDIHEEVRGSVEANVMTENQI